MAFVFCMTEQERLEVLRDINILKKIYHHHTQNDIIQDSEERMKHLNDILDRIRELEKLLQEDSNTFN